MERTIAVVIPWMDEAVATLHPAADADDLSEVVATGTLLSVALDLASRDAPTLKRTRIALPNRGHSPFSFQGMALMQLIAVARAMASTGDTNAT